MLDKVNADTFLSVAAVIGWLAFVFITVRTALRHIVGKSDAPEDHSFAAAINRDLLKAIAEEAKEQTETIHKMATRQAVLETRLLAVEAELKERR